MHFFRYLIYLHDIRYKFHHLVQADEERKSHIVDEDKVMDAIEDDLEKGGLIIDWHVCDIFPERLIDLVVVLRTDNTILYDRLKKRGYTDNKVEENIDAEIMQVILDEAQEAYAEEIVIELESNDVDQMDSNVERIVAWKNQWEKDNKE
ncbi:Fap7p [Sugiyamaella lignohabitans]|uniref:Fap7p n=1 Tax=Sugiyamaella lignohabitans TaxID=796027 RepID=A0A167EH87_9ASCO|nr:Fap7p [Sugiyamaella lignohabitans]ANB14082.1 Fap7p [Sugiyamaella lignohabitans]